MTIIVHNLAAWGWFLQHSSVFENWIRSKSLVVNTKVGGIPIIGVWKIDIATSCLLLNLRTDQDVVAEKVLVIDKSLVGVEEACIKGIGDKLNWLVNQSCLTEMGTYHCTCDWQTVDQVGKHVVVQDLEEGVSKLHVIPANRYNGTIQSSLVGWKRTGEVVQNIAVSPGFLFLSVSRPDIADRTYLESFTTP
jgi:hypothetical protein